MIGRIAQRARGADAGFTLVELLIVIVILGILAAVVVIAVSGISDRGQTKACDTDQRALEAAQEASFAKDGFYRGETKLRNDGFLRNESTYYDFSAPSASATGASYTIVPASGSACT